MEPDPRRPETSAAEPPLPRTFGRYVLLRLLARGGMGEVYLAASGDIEGAERPVVIKVIRREHAKDPSFLARFLDEARVQSRLGYPGVAQVVEASMEGDEPFVAVEYVEGRSLAEVRAKAVQQGIRIGWADACALAAQIAESLAVVHDHKDERGTPLAIAHRDLSPQNVMVSFDGETKLIDFGTARGANRKSRTVAGVVYAKPGYVAPEVANGIPGDAGVDVYALGVMLWELVAGRRFLQGDAQEHMIAVGQNKRPLPPVAGSVDAPAELDAVIAAMTTHDRAARVPAKEACALLIKVLGMAPALPSGERSVRSRVAQLATSLWRDEPVRSRTEFQRLLAGGRKVRAEALQRAKEAREQRDASDATTVELRKDPAPAPAPVDPTLIPGTRYRMVRTVGEGASGIVYEARHVDLDRRVAVKVLSPGRAARPDDVARLRREAQTLGDLSHPGLVRVHDFGMTSDGRAFLAMEFLEGESLDKRLSRGPEIDWHEAAHVAEEALSALSAAHGEGIVHRDVSPQNLMLLLDGGVKVLDFGVACDPANGEEEAFLDGDLTLFGTPEYMAPEQADGVVDARCDVYAMGAVLYEMLTGRRPFADEAGLAVISAKRKELPEKPSHRAPTRGIPEVMDEVVMRAIAIQPKDRFQTAEEMREALFGALTSGERSRGLRRSIGKVAVGVAMAAALAIVGLGVAQRNPAVRDRFDAALARVGVTKPKAAPAPVVAPEVVAAETKQEPAAPKADEAPKPVVAEAAPQAAPVADEEEKPAAKPNDDPNSPRMKAKAAMEKRHWHKAKKLVDEWMKQDPSDEAKLAMARTLSHVGKGKEAVALVKELVEASPANDAARELLHDLESKHAYRTAHQKPKAKGDKPAKKSKKKH